MVSADTLTSIRESKTGCHGAQQWQRLRSLDQLGLQSFFIDILLFNSRLHFMVPFVVRESLKCHLNKNNTKMVSFLPKNSFKNFITIHLS